MRLSSSTSATVSEDNYCSLMDGLSIVKSKIEPAAITCFQSTEALLGRPLFLSTLEKVRRQASDAASGTYLHQSHLVIRAKQSRIYIVESLAGDQRSERCNELLLPDPRRDAVCMSYDVIFGESGPHWRLQRIIHSRSASSNFIIWWTLFNANKTCKIYFGTEFQNSNFGQHRYGMYHVLKLTI